ncbi:putative glycerol:H+ symporter [Xylariaceae sp. FL0594]|nr:putative glycerol:H+ symporter [Xylariaceae sp. FL0594]
MGALSFLGKIYDLDTLDTRFTVSSNTPYKAHLDTRNDAAAASRDRAAKWNTSRATKSRWNTTEFYLYYLVFIFAVPYMFWVAYNASRVTHPNYINYARYLSPGWIPGRKIDVTDTQYRNLRRNLPYLVALLVFHPLLRRLYNSFTSSERPSNGEVRPTLEEADRRLDQRASYDFGFAVLFLLALHGVSAFKVFTILYLNYNLVTSLPRRYIPVATWVFNIGILFANELGRGYRLREVGAALSGFVSGGAVSEPNSFLAAWGGWLDSYGGLMNRWEVLFNITVLRLVSFDLDYYWSLDRRDSSPVEKQLDPSSLSERDRVATPGKPRDYSFRNYVAYALYAPLYIAGPIITFNDFLSQQRYKPATVETSRTVRYGLRFVLAFLVMEVVLHYDYVQAIAKFSPRWSEYTASQLCVLSFMNLHMIWLKLLLPWRLFRLWSLVDGVDPPENMIRCVSNNWSTLAFWRSWHRSFYRWSLRYIYVPLGGSSFRTKREAARSVLTYAVVFTFVALWHDIKLNLLVWGWLIVFFMLPEMAAGALFPKRRWEGRPTAYRMLCAAGAVANILMMIMANLVGFAFGIDGLKAILSGIFSQFSGYVFLAGACTALFVGVQAMFEIRESEKRRGVDLRC